MILICVTKKLLRDLAVSGEDSGHVGGEVYAPAITVLLRLADKDLLCTQLREFNATIILVTEGCFVRVSMYLAIEHLSYGLVRVLRPDSSLFANL